MSNVINRCDVMSRARNRRDVMGYNMNMHGDEYA